MKFTTEYQKIVSKFDDINPAAYAKTRNFVDGAVTHLSPYISRGVISTKIVYEYLQMKGYGLHNAEKLIQELAWRDYWQQIWMAKGDAINTDLKSKQVNVTNHGTPTAIIEGTTGIDAIDTAIQSFYKTGYIHNHVRMYIASITCNVAGSHWLHPAKWMYYYLLDADWASNALSWQWVASTNSNKKYYANQQNINKYCYSKQSNTFLDVSYEQFTDLETPTVLKSISNDAYTTKLKPHKVIKINPNLPTLIYNFYNLDPLWKADVEANRVLLLEPSLFKRYPVSDESIAFAIALSKNIHNIQLYFGEFEQLKTEYELKTVYFKEHPLNKNYTGTEEPRDSMFNVSGYFPSFFAFWKQCKKQFNSELIN